jgi:hypothetical protein
VASEFFSKIQKDLTVCATTYGRSGFWAKFVGVSCDLEKVPRNIFSFGDIREANKSSSPEELFFVIF